MTVKDPIVAFKDSLFEAIDKHKNTTLNDRDAETLLVGMIMKAARQLVDDSAMEMAEAATNSLMIPLLAIYKNGSNFGHTQNKLLNELAEILAEAGARNNADSATHSA